MNRFTKKIIYERNEKSINKKFITLKYKHQAIHMQYERKIIQIFKSFIEKALVPQIKRMEGSLFEWNKFNAMISN